MALEPDVIAKVLEQTKKNLYILYGSDHFTERQWVNIDFWVNREKYVWTNGPKETILDEELLSFDEPTKIPISTIQPTKLNHVESNSPDVFTVSGKELSSPAFFDFTENLDSPVRTPTTSAEASSDDEPAIEASTKSAVIPTPVSEPPPTTTTKEVPREQPAQAPSPGQLPPGITLAQLEEAKAFKSSWAVKYDSVNGTSSSRKGKKKPELFSEDSGYSSVTSEANTRASALGIGKSNVSSPTPIKILSRSSLKPNCPEFRPHTARPSSRASHISGRSVNSKINAGMIVRARIDQKKTSIAILEVHAGDIIKVLTLVSGQLWNCENVQTKHHGQVEARVLDVDGPQGDALLKQQQITMEASRQRAPSQSTVRSYSVDGFEQSNAAEWDEVPIVSRTKAVTSPLKPKLSGLTSSRFAVLPDEAVNHSDNGEEAEATTLRDQVSNLVENKIAEILATHSSQNLDNVLSRAPSRAGLNKFSRVPAKGPPFSPPAPKTVTCWFWHMQQHNPHRDGCRYQDMDCWNLHYYPDGVANAKFPLNKEGKPTWAALSDAEEAEVPPHKRPFSCWYWATRGQCSNSADTCKYMHANVAAGVATRPGPFLRHSWRSSIDATVSWRSTDNATWDPTDDSVACVDESERKENQTPDPEILPLTGWETEEDVRPDFVKELEEKVEKEADSIW